MADEAEQVEEIQDDETTSVDASLEEFQQLLDGAPEEEEAAEETEQAEGVEQSADGDAVETEEVAETTTVADEGPSFLMKQEAVRVGLPIQLIEFCRDDRQLQQMIEMAAPGSAPQDDPEEESPYKFTLPEEEFGSDDPVAKQIRAIVDAANAERAAAKAERAAIQKELDNLKGEQAQREQAATAAHYEQLYKPFDEYLDSLQDPRFGVTSKRLNAAQLQEREAVAAKYLGIGATPGASAEQKRLLAELALRAHAPDVIEKRTKQQPASDPRRQVLGGGSKRTPAGKLTERELLEHMDKALRGQKPLQLN